MCFHAQNGFVQCQVLRYLRGLASPLVGVKSVWLLDPVLAHAGAGMHTMTVSASFHELGQVCMQQAWTARTLNPSTLSAICAGVDVAA